MNLFVVWDAGKGRYEETCCFDAIPLLTQEEILRKLAGCNVLNFTESIPVDSMESFRVINTVRRITLKSL